MFYSRRAIVERHSIYSGNGGLDLATVLALLTEIILETLFLNVSQLPGQGGDGGGADGEELHFDVVARAGLKTGCNGKTKSCTYYLYYS